MFREGVLLSCVIPVIYYKAGRLRDNYDEAYLLKSLERPVKRRRSREKDRVYSSDKEGKTKPVFCGKRKDKIQ